MKRYTHVAAAAVGVLVVFGVGTSDADAQEVRRYGDDSGGSSNSGSGGNQQGGTVYPGQPMPQSNESSQSSTRQVQQRQRKGDGDGEKQPARSMAIRVHKPGNLKKKKAKKASNEVVNRPPEKLYRGVIPGTRNSVDHLPAEDGSDEPTNRLTWLGFQPEADRTRIFVQTSRNPDYERNVSETDNGPVVSITLANTTISAENFRRNIDATAFGRVVRGVVAVEQEGSTVVKIQLRESASPSFSASDNYLYIDFPRKSDEAQENGDGDV